MKRKKDVEYKSDEELQVAAILALHKALGHVDAHRFLTSMSHEKTDYVKISKELYKGQTIEGIFDRAKRNWKPPRKLKA